MKAKRTQPRLVDLEVADVAALHLAAQVMRHKAEYAERPAVAAWFGELERRAQVELARRRESVGGRPAATDGESVAVGPRLASVADRRLVGEYLDLLVGNERLSASLRAFCRALEPGQDD